MAELDAGERLSVFRGKVIATDNDPILQEIVEQAASLAETPLAAVNLIMGSVQFFRASRGLPPELEKTRATSREDSFCQFVVKSESSFKVEAASSDERVPQRLVKAYGIESYLGVPVTVDGQLAGSLCVFDVKSRGFSAEVETKLNELAARASSRLDELGTPSEPAPTDATPEPSPLESAKDLAFQARLLERAMSEVGALVRIGSALSRGELSAEEAERAASVLTEAVPMFELLIGESQRMRVASSQLVERLGSDTHA